MTITATSLTRAAGVAAAIAGAIFIAVQIKHPPMVGASDRDHAVGGAQLRQGGHGGARAGRHHRHVPAPVPPGRAARPRRLPDLRGRIPDHVQRRGHRRRRPAGPGRTEPGLRQRRHRRGRRRHARRRHRRHADPAQPDRRRLPRSAASCSASPCSAPASWPAGRRAARRRHRWHRRAGGAAGVVQPAVGRPGRGRPHRPRRLAVAQPAPGHPPPRPCPPARPANTQSDDHAPSPLHRPAGVPTAIRSAALAGRFRPPSSH